MTSQQPNDARNKRLRKHFEYTYGRTALLSSFVRTMARSLCCIHCYTIRYLHLFITWISASKPPNISSRLYKIACGIRLGQTNDAFPLFWPCISRIAFLSIHSREQLRLSHLLIQLTYVHINVSVCVRSENRHDFPCWFDSHTERKPSTQSNCLTQERRAIVTTKMIITVSPVIISHSRRSCSDSTIWNMPSPSIRLTNVVVVVVVVDVSSHWCRMVVECVRVASARMSALWMSVWVSIHFVLLLVIFGFTASLPYTNPSVFSWL